MWSLNVSKREMLYQRKSGTEVDRETTWTSPCQHWSCYMLKDVRIQIFILLSHWSRRKLGFWLSYYTQISIMARDTNLLTLTKCGWIKLRDCPFPAIYRWKGEAPNPSFFCSSSFTARPCNYITAIPERTMTKIESTLVTLFVNFILISIIHLWHLNVTTKTSLFSTPFWEKIQNSLIYPSLHRHVWNHLVKEQSRSPCRKFHIDWIWNCAAAKE